MKLTVVIALSGAVAACDSGPAFVPTPTTGQAVLGVPRPSRPIALNPGPYWLQIYGHALSDNPSEPVCAPAGVPAQGTFVNALVRVERLVDEWVAQSVPGEGTLELRFFDAGSGIGGAAVAGTVSGSSRDSEAASVRPATNVSVTLGGFSQPAANVRGVAAAGSFLYGAISGRIAFSDPSGASSSCPLVYWTLQPVPGTARIRAGD